MVNCGDSSARMTCLVLFMASEKVMVVGGVLPLFLKRKGDNDMNSWSLWRKGANKIVSTLMVKSVFKR
jgi:hypothetical protein